MKSRIAAIRCNRCGEFSTLPVEKLPLPIPGLSVTVEVNPTSDDYTVTVHNWAAEPSRHAREIVPYSRTAAVKVGEAVNRCFETLANWSGDRG